MARDDSEGAGLCRRWATGLILLLWVAGNAVGQLSTGSLRGTITDPHGAVVAGAEIAVENLVTRVLEHVLRTDQNGNYAAEALSPGVYEITITKHGFARCIDRIDLQVGRVVVLDAALNLAQCGHDLGMAFQIVDDVLDLTESESVLGKPVASDLREGKVTMAVIHALERCTPAERKQIETVLRDRAFNGVTHADILAILNHYSSIEYASYEASRYAESARNAICVFPDFEIKRALLWAPEFVVARGK